MTKLSIVVPTRERADTLRHTIRTLVNQDYQDCEIIVCDNASIDDTKCTVDSFVDSRIRYINTGRRISMADNWEYALQHVGGEFVTYIGDDDGFLPGALTKAMNLLEKLRVDALVWDKVEYCWPDHVDENLRNWISLKLGNDVLQMANGRKRLAKVLQFHEGYTRLPCLYNGIIRASLVRKIAASSTNGIFFNSISPDVFSAIALSSLIDTYALTDHPFSVNGASRHSNGTAFVRPQAPAEKSANPTQIFRAENLREYDSRLKMAPSASYCVMGELLLAKRFLPKAGLPEPYWKEYVQALVRNAEKSLDADAVLQSARHTRHELKMNTNIPGHIVSRTSNSPAMIGFGPGSFNFKAPISMVSNVFDACQLVGGMLPTVNLESVESPIHEFARKMRASLLFEMIRLYRAI